ncbi:MAG: hypothetical protein HY735_16130 [Verrucomicrobia bacterium]|nr:hypothetical protein [Verrucomicrobiota bacterium]
MRSHTAELMHGFCILVRIFAVATAAAVAASVVGQTRPQPGVSAVPQIYLIHYAPDAPRDPRFVAKLREAPPDILHLGHAVPLNSIFGPTADYSGWNPKLVGAPDILKRQGELREFVNKLHQAGIAKVICYINPSILGGDHEKRLGFWAFYDQWKNYETLGIGPKSTRPPEAWMQRPRRSFAPWEPEPNYPLWRYQPCANEPAWRKYQSAVVRLIAECGYDGVFVDDCIMECRHDLCAERFPEFLKKRYSFEALQRTLGGDLSLAATRSGSPAEPADQLRSAETHLFWQESIANLLEELNRAGRTVNSNFFTLPNWGATARVVGAASRARTGKSSAVWRRAAADQMFEEDHPPGYFGTNDVVGYLLQFNYGLELGIRPAILSYGTTRRHVELGYAEAAAGGGGSYVEPTAAFPDVRRKWREFFKANRNLFEGFTLVAPVALVVSFDEPRYGNDRHLRDVFASARTLCKLHVPFAALPLENLTSKSLSRHRLILASELKHLSNAQIGVLKDFLRNGGRLLATGACGEYDELALPRKGAPWAGLDLYEGIQPPPSLRPDQGAAVRLATLQDVVPKREFTAVDTLEIRKPDTFVARLRELTASGADAADYSRFGQWLESLGGGHLSLAKSAPAVCTVAYQRLGEADARMTVHAVRYSVPTWGGDDAEVKPLPVSLEIPLPRGWTLERARVLSPGEPAALLETQINAGKVRCELPPFEFYSLLSLKLRPIQAPKQTSSLQR